jgi:hypothetical protein
MIKQEAVHKQPTVGFDHVYADETAAIRLQRETRQRPADVADYSGASCGWFNHLWRSGKIWTELRMRWARLHLILWMSV